MNIKNIYWSYTIFNIFFHNSFLQNIRWDLNYLFTFWKPKDYILSIIAYNKRKVDKFIIFMRQKAGFERLKVPRKIIPIIKNY